MHEAILVAYRRYAQAMIRRAQTRAKKARLTGEHAECVLRNRAKLLVQRLSQTNEANYSLSRSHHHTCMSTRALRTRSTSPC